MLVTGSITVVTPVVQLIILTGEVVVDMIVIGSVTVLTVVI
jgi:hypothetical protein